MVNYHLTEIHPEILQDNIVELTLDENLISVIPSGIGKLKKLESFSIVKNKYVLIYYICARACIISHSA